MTQRSHPCEICKSTEVVPVLDLGTHPLCDDLIPVGAPERCEEFPIEIALCRSCMTAHQIHHVPKRRLFPQSYHYRSAMTQDVLAGMTGLVQDIESSYGSLKGKFVVDIGCNDGSLLKRFATAGARVCGVEPTGAALDAQAAGLNVIREFYDPVTARKLVAQYGHPDFITFTNVFAHIENMDELLEAVALTMNDNTRLVVENHYLGAVLDRFQFDTFYHEHPRTYSLTSFAAIAKRLGRKLEHCSFPARYGGNIRVIIGPGNHIAMASLANESNFFEKFATLRAIIGEWVADSDSLLDRARSNDGKVYAKAFPGRAAILIKMLNLDADDVEVVFEKPNSMKIGHYVPGTRIPIGTDNSILTSIPAPRRILNLAWHIAPEIKSYLTGFDPNIEVVDIFSPSHYMTRCE
jgi:SAM-dependent methyltransferase